MCQCRRGEFVPTAEPTTRIQKTRLRLFARRSDWGAHMIEFDVASTKDGQLVLMHDRTVDRTTDGSGPPSELTLAEVKALDAGSWKGPSFKDERGSDLGRSARDHA